MKIPHAVAISDSPDVEGWRKWVKCGVCGRAECIPSESVAHASRTGGTRHCSTSEAHVTESGRAAKLSNVRRETRRRTALRRALFT